MTAFEDKKSAEDRARYSPLIVPDMHFPEIPSSDYALSINPPVDVQDAIDRALLPSLRRQGLLFNAVNDPEISKRVTIVDYQSGKVDLVPTEEGQRDLTFNIAVVAVETPENFRWLWSHPLYDEVAEPNREFLQRLRHSAAALNLERINCDGHPRSIENAEACLPLTRCLIAVAGELLDTEWQLPLYLQVPGSDPVQHLWCLASTRHSRPGVMTDYPAKMANAERFIRDSSSCLLDCTANRANAICAFAESIGLCAAKFSSGAVAIGPPGGSVYGRPLLLAHVDQNKIRLGLAA